LAAAQSEVTSLRPNLDLLLQEKSRLQRELAEARMLKDQHLEHAQELQKDLELRANFEADLIQAQEILTQKDKELEEEKQLREHQLTTLKEEYEKVVEDLKSQQKMTDLLDALHNQGTFDALSNLSTLADAVVHIFYFTVTNIFYFKRSNSSIRASDSSVWMSKSY
jgi:alkylated DNA repair dioxygenase AlkB